MNLRDGMVHVIVQYQKVRDGYIVINGGTLPRQYADAGQLLDALLSFLAEHTKEWEEAADDGFSTIRSVDFIAALRGTTEEGS